jgi:hypothetical protein
MHFARPRQVAETLSRRLLEFLNETLLYLSTRICCLRRIVSTSYLEFLYVADVNALGTRRRSNAKSSLG